MPISPRPGRVCWGGAFALVAVGLQLLPGWAEQLRFTRPAFADGAIWQLFTAQWVHLTLAHALVNAMAAVLLCWLLAPWVAVRRQLLSFAGGLVGVAVVLALDSNCQYYAGASGALHGVLSGAAIVLLRTSSPELQRYRLQRALGAGLLLVLVTKLLVQTVSGAPSPSWLGIPTYYPAHVAGAIGGAAAVLVVLLLRPRHTAQQDSR